MEQTNATRANSVRPFAAKFANQTGMTHPTERNSVIGDLITNLLHLAAEEGHDTSAIVRLATDHFTHEQTEAQTQTAPNLVWVFAESEAVPSCQKTGRRMEFLAPTREEAARNLEYTLKLSDGRARLGKTGLVAYPHGIDGACVYGACWVFDAQETARAQGDSIPGAEVNL